MDYQTPVWEFVRKQIEAGEVFPLSAPGKGNMTCPVAGRETRIKEILSGTARGQYVVTVEDGRRFRVPGVALLSVFNAPDAKKEEEEKKEEKEPPALDDLTKAELFDLAKSNEIQVPDKANKAELVEIIIEAFQEEESEGE